ncbi:MAG: MopE-related protein [Myxococcota bacterium]|nr:MopE-related protein [Myxococcota bacterium]
MFYALRQWIGLSVVLPLFWLGCSDQANGEDDTRTTTDQSSASEDTLDDSASASGSETDSQDSQSHGSDSSDSGSQTWDTQSDTGTEELDGDSDGWGDPFDCNDLDSEVNPGVEEELGNKIDDDCDGVTDESSGQTDSQTSDTDEGTETQDTSSSSDTMDTAVSCGGDLDCPPEQFCDPSGQCADDVCDPEESSCEDGEVIGCAANGSGTKSVFSCGSGGYFASECVEGGGQAFCVCEDDWDCPTYTTCNVDICAGTGVEPTCTLPPIAFAQERPRLELHWGGDSRTGNAHDGTPEANPVPWPTIKHVLVTPVVANLDDDNGDGRINELDFPEIIFVAHAGNTPWSDGVVRAIHGGGPRKGADFFSRCGDVLWTEDAPIGDACVAPRANSGVPVVVADLNDDGVPEIVVINENKTFDILDNRGALIYRLPSAWSPSTIGDTASAVNLDHTGYAELVIGPHVFVLGDDSMSGSLIVTHILSGSKSIGLNSQGSMACPADLDPNRAFDEIAVGTTLYALPQTIPACGSPPCTGALEVLWYAPDIGSQATVLNAPAYTTDGYCAVADLWGANLSAAPGPSNPPDGAPEVILIANGNLIVLSGATGTLIDFRSLGGTQGGAPNVDDFDGDGFMEVASALKSYYIVLDLQEPAETNCPAWPVMLPRALSGANPNLPASERTPGGIGLQGSCSLDGDCNAGAVCGAGGACVCLHNGWRRGSDDESSAITTSSVFDFNGDGSAEVVYNDECELRVYRGLDGAVLYNETSRSRTGIENSVVADVDNDGNAEIVAVSNNAITERCKVEGPAGIEGVNGVRVFGDPADAWVSARRIWNQQSYHVTHVTEAGAIPPREPESWKTLNGRSYNTYRSQPRVYGVAPDLAITGMQVSSPNAQCGTLTDVIDINVRLENQGDLRIGPGVVIGFYGIWENDTQEPLMMAGGVTPLTVVLQTSLEPKDQVIVSVTYEVSNSLVHDVLPGRVVAVADDGDKEKECREANNTYEDAVEPGELLPDLVLEIDEVDEATCPAPKVTLTVRNEGSAMAEDVTVALYAGDPGQGGTEIGEVAVGDVAQGQEKTVEVNLFAFPSNLSIRIYGAVDPRDEIKECNDGNNAASASHKVMCVEVH